VKTLVVEDEAGSRILLTAVLTRLGYEVVSFEDAEHAWEACQEEIFNLIVLDWILPGMDGLELCRQIRSLEWGDLAIILVVTAYDLAQDLQRVFNAGADDFLAKPINPETLELRLRIAAHQHTNLMERKLAEDALQAAHDELEVRVGQRTTELSQAVVALRQSEEQYRTLVENVSDVVFATDTTGIITYISPVITRIAGYDPHEMTGTPLSSYVPPEDAEGIGFVEPAPTTDDHQLEHRLLTKDGRELHVHTSLRRQLDGDALTGYTGILSDISTSKLLEDRLRLTQKMEVLGQFAGAIAHDFNNLTMVLLGVTELIRRSWSDDARLQQELAVIHRVAQGAADLSQSLLSFAKKRTLDPVELSLNELINDMMPLLRRLLPDGISLRRIAGRDVGVVRLDRTQMEQVLLNLVANARDAMPDGGDIIIETGTKRLDITSAQAKGSATQELYAFVSVRDTGDGMSEETLSHVFDPFFTTKQPGSGTGLGLAAVYTAVQMHGGFIDVSSAPGVGTDFLVYLPQVQVSGEHQQIERSPAPAEGGCETLLIVDDNAELREVMRGYLESMGYRALTAEDGQQALMILRRATPRIELVITDLSMPHTNGIELFEQGQALDPAMQFLLCTGFADDSVTSEIADKANVAFMQKPFTTHTLAHKVRELLDRQAEGT